VGRKKWEGAGVKKVELKNMRRFAKPVSDGDWNYRRIAIVALNDGECGSGYVLWGRENTSGKKREEPLSVGAGKKFYPCGEKIASGGLSIRREMGSRGELNGGVWGLSPQAIFGGFEGGKRAIGGEFRARAVARAFKEECHQIRMRQDVSRDSPM